MRELRVAIVGGGGFMGKAHSLAYAVAPLAADLGATIRKSVLVDATEEQATRAAASLGWESSATDWRAVVESDDIDIVDIVTPPGPHEEIALAAISAGKHVFCEKPITNDSVSAERMAVMAREAGVVNQVGFNYRHTPAIAFARQAIDEERIGRPLQFRASYLQEVGFYSDPNRWRAKKSTGGSGTVGDIGSHIIDIAQHLFGEIVSVSGQMRAISSDINAGWRSEEERLGDDLIDDVGMWHARFENGAVGSFVASSYSSGRKNRIAFDLDGSAGSIDFNWNDREEFKISYVDGSEDERGFRTVHTGPAHPDSWWKLAGLGTGYVEVAGIQLQKFVRSIVGGTSADPDFAVAAQVQRVVEAIDNSARRSSWVDVRPEGSGV